MPESEAADIEYTVVLRSRSGARVRPGHYIDLSDFPDGLGDLVQVRISNRWDDVGLDHPVPRELWMAVRVKAQNLDAAVRSATSATSAAAIILSFCVNALVEPPALHVVFNSTEGLARREFMEVFLPDERGQPHIGRWIDVDSLMAFGHAACASPEARRLFRALAQYQVALRFWNTGSQLLALAHLYITCEVLTKAVLRTHQVRLGISEKEHAELLGVDITQKKWRMFAESFARREYIFKGDTTMYEAARKASDAFEHGYADLGNIRQTADSVTREVFDLVRSAILTLVPSLDQAVAGTIMSKHPVDVSPLYKQVTGYIVSEEQSDPLNLGIEGELFPTLRWQSGIRASRLEDDKLILEPEETFTVQFAPGLRFEVRDLAIYGGMNPAPADVSTPRPSGWDQGDWVARELAEGNQGMTLKTRNLLAAVMSLVDAATAGSADVSRTFPQMLAFSLFGQGLAYFQSAQTLIADNQPVEALPLLRGLVTIAARFEQMTRDGSEGLGLVIRLAIDSLDDELPDGAGNQAVTVKEELLQNAIRSGLLVPNDVRPPETTTIWHTLTAEMRMAQHAVEGRYWTVGLHLGPGDGADHLAFHTKLQPGPFTDLIASACAIAQLELLKQAASVFGWTIDIQRIDALLTAATELNETSAHSEDSGPAVDGTAES
ncbi:MAG: hypothetical protein ABSB55_01485 [Acidimicrobiales bacterium]